MTQGMFCFQCEQTAGGTGCTRYGVCGKDPEVAALQDLLIHQLKGIGYHGARILEQGEIDDEIHDFVHEALFHTLTNVDFDPERLEVMLNRAAEIKDDLRERAPGACCGVPNAVQYRLPASREEMVADALGVGVQAGDLPEDLRSLREILVYGLKGIAAYAHHARVLGHTDREVDEFMYRALDSTLGEFSAEDMLEMVLEAGRINLRCMELLDRANTDRFGHPEPTEALITKKKGPFIVVSGHDLADLEEILEQTEGTGVNVYTHGEMLPALAYPELKKYDHLVGNFGGAWYAQTREFDGIPGCIVMTTNCLQKPKPSYQDRIFTTGPVAWPRVTHIEEEEGRKDFGPVIDRALELAGWSEDEDEKRITIGFAHGTVLAHADTVVEAVKEGDISHFFLVGGCDGAKGGRSYFTEFAEMVPTDCIILTLGCGKYRFNDRDFGEIGGLPRLMDLGQCNDAFSAVKIALALADAFDCDVNELPLSLVLSWYEQKAVSILLSLLHLGVKGIKLGPSLPAFVSPGVLEVLVDNFDISPISDPASDLEAILG